MYGTIIVHLSCVSCVCIVPGLTGGKMSSSEPVRHMLTISIHAQ